MSVIIIRPKTCRWCTHIFYGFKHIVDEAEKLKVPFIDLAGEKAVKEKVLEAINQHPDYNFIFGTGHGSPSMFTAEYMLPVFTISNVDVLKGKDVFLHSCLTANRLGPEAIRNGAKSYCGYLIEWAWTFTENKEGGFLYPDPYNDPKAKYFFESANTYPISLLRGKSTRESLELTKDAYNYWIDYLFEKGGKEAAQIIGLLALDRDGTVLLGEEALKSPVMVKPSPVVQMIKYSIPLGLMIGVTMMGKS